MQPIDDEEPRRVSVALLAAGAGRRFRGSGHKLLARLPATDERPAESVAQRSMAHALLAFGGRLTVVTGHHSATELGLSMITGLNDAQEIHNHRWADGQATSVSAAVDAAADDDADVLVIGLADQPGIEPGAWRAVADSASATTPIAVATYDGRRANPVGLHSSVWPLLDRTGDAGARTLMTLRPELVVQVPCSGSPNDIDTEEDLRRWQSN